MPQVYVHLRGESSKILLQKEGIIKRTEGDNVFRLLHPNTQAEFQESLSLRDEWKFLDSETDRVYKVYTLK